MKRLRQISEQEDVTPKKKKSEIPVPPALSKKEQEKKEKKRLEKAHIAATTPEKEVEVEAPVVESPHKKVATKVTKSPGKSPSSKKD